MQAPSVFLLLGAAAAVAVLHSILPDHWVPLAIVARTQRWSLLRVTWVSTLASFGHVFASLILAGVVALIGLQFQQELETQQGHIIGGILILTGLGFLIWALLRKGHGHTHDHSGAVHTHTAPDHAHNEHTHHDHAHDHSHPHPHKSTSGTGQSTLAGRITAVVVSLGIAASPDLTILPVALAATPIGWGAIVSVLGVFTILTLATFVGLTLLATVAGYQVKGVWIEKNANILTSLVLLVIGLVAFIGF